MEDIKFSFCVPNYNDGRFIGKCLESILKQDYENYEVLIHDNHSTDNSLEIINEYLKRDIRFHLVPTQPWGIGAARGINAAMKLATGDVGVFLPSDDYLEYDYCSNSSIFFSNPKIGFVRIAIFTYTLEDPTLKYMQPEKWTALPEIMLMNKVFPSSPFRTKLFKQVGGLDEGELTCWDWDFWIRAIFSGYDWATSMAPVAVRLIHFAECTDMNKDMEYIDKKYGVLGRWEDGHKFYDEKIIFKLANREKYEA